MLNRCLLRKNEEIYYVTYSNRPYALAFLINLNYEMENKNQSSLVFSLQSLDQKKKKKKILFNVKKKLTKIQKI